MKVLHVISSGGMYGAEAVILNLSRALNRGSHRSMLAVFSNLSNPNHQLHEKAVEEGIESHLIACKSRIDRIAIASIRELAIRTGADPGISDVANWSQVWALSISAGPAAAHPQSRTTGPWPVNTTLAG